MINAVGSPPPTRGTRKIYADEFRVKGITPAYAGNTTDADLALIDK